MPAFLPVPSNRNPWDLRQTIRFGGLPVPVTGVTMPWIDLNDQVSWFAQDIVIDGKYVSLKSAQYTWRGRGAWMSQDFIGRKISVPMIFDEGGAFTPHEVDPEPISWSAMSSMLAAAGEQYLTFDNTFGMRVKCDGFGTTKFLRGEYPYIIQTQLEFQARNPFLERIAGIVSVPEHTITQSGPGAAADTGWSVSYGGQMYAEPVWTMYCDAGDNTGRIAQVGVSNASVAQGVAMNFSPPLTPGGHIFTFDCSQFYCSVDGREQPPSGDFPFIYPGFPPPFTNVMQFWISLASGNQDCRAHFTYAEKYGLEPRHENEER
jgi:hypothetical protein